MAKFLIKIKARKLRGSGKSIKDIAKKLGVTQGTVSLWCRDIKLSSEQLAKLMKSKSSRVTFGRLKGAQTQRLKRLNIIKSCQDEAKSLKTISRNEFFLSGLSLYLAEGSKTYGTVQFTNSNPSVVRFMLNWFKEIYKIQDHQVKCSLIINGVYRKDDKKVKLFWSDYLGIHLDKFTNTRFIKSNPKKIFAHRGHYFGTFNFRILKSSRLLYMINAYCNQLLSLKDQK